MAPKYRRTSFTIPEKLWVELKIYCVLTNRNMGEFIRISVSDKIKELKQKKDD